MSNDGELEALYPFLQGRRQDPGRLQAALLGSVTEKARDSRDTNERFFTEQAPLLVTIARVMADCFRANGRLLAMGNGGSSCDAAHVTVEFVHPVTAGRPPLPAINLTADIAQITAVGNDVGIEHIFARQIGALGCTGDVVVGLSTSGNSANLLAGFAKAREMGLATVGFAGGDGGRMQAGGLVDHCLVVPSRSIHRIQECHVAAYHIIWDLVHTLLADDRGSAMTRKASA